LVASPEPSPAASPPSPPIDASTQAPPPPSPPPLPAWRATLAELERLGKLLHPAFDVPGGYKAIAALLATASGKLATLVAALPADAPDLAEAACQLSKHGHDRGVVEAQLLRGIAAARRQAIEPAQRYGSLRAQYLSVEMGWKIREGRLAQDDTDRRAVPRDRCRRS
jgi:hypothetical protein